MTTSAFGAALREWRVRADLTRDQAATEFGVSRQTWQRWETTPMLPTGAHAEAIAQRTGLEVPEGRRGPVSTRIARIQIVPAGGEVLPVEGVARVDGGFLTVTEPSGTTTIYPAHALARVVVKSL